MAVKMFGDGGFVATGEHIPLIRMKVLLSGLKLEKMGLEKRGRSCYSIIKSEFKLKGSRDSVYEQFEEIIKKAEVEIGWQQKQNADRAHTPR